MSEIVPPEIEPEVGAGVETEVAIEQIEQSFGASGPLVAILAGSGDDMARLAPAEEYLRERGIEVDARTIDAPAAVGAYCEGARADGIKVIVVGAALATALPGIAAAHTDLPVIGVPLVGEGVEGSDALLATAQVPAASPVACVAIDGAENAAVLAARIINA
jgi:5-(carboxyamino)imidazole ribonucleotide mutase